jgi:hypothetical protein
MATRAKRPANKSPSRPVSKSAPDSSSPGARAGMGTKPVRSTASQSNYCPDHGRLLRSDRTCPVSSCKHHDAPASG